MPAAVRYMDTVKVYGIYMLYFSYDVAIESTYCVCLKSERNKILLYCTTISYTSKVAMLLIYMMMHIIIAMM